MDEVKIYQGLTAVWEEVQDIKSYVDEKIDEIELLKSDLIKTSKALGNLNKALFDMISMIEDKFD